MRVAWSVAAKASVRRGRAVLAWWSTGWVRGIGLSALLALLGLGLALLVGGGPPTLAADPTIGCSQTDLQSALNQAPANGALFTITLPANCPINLTGTLTIGGGRNITIDGNGLVLNGVNQSFDIIQIGPPPPQPSTLTLNDVTIKNGIRGIDELSSFIATVHLVGSTVSDNSSTGIFANTVTVTNSTVSDNGDRGIAGGTVTATNSTVSGNAIGFDAAGTVVVTNGTISGNQLDGIYAGSSATITASLLAGNGSNCVGAAPTDGGYNLSTDASCGFSATGSHDNVSASSLNLQPLANNGGPTQTIALGPGSIAIDAIPLNGQGQCVVGEPTDQRGIARPQGPACDIGAYEAQPVANWLFFPWVPNGEMVEGTGPWYGSVTLQNQEDAPVAIHVATVAGGPPLAGLSDTLAPHAAVTVDAASLFANLSGKTGSGFAVEATWAAGAGGQTAGPTIAGVEKQAEPATDTFGVTTSSSQKIVDGYTALPAADVAWGPKSLACTTSASGCNALGPSLLGLPTSSFFGASGSPGSAFSFTGTSFLPIVQANWTGWNTRLNVTNIDASSPAGVPEPVTISFSPAGGSSAPAITTTVDVAAGQTVHVDVASVLADDGITTPFVGSAKLTSNYAMVASVERVKASTTMALINTSAPDLLTTTTPNQTSVDGVPVVDPETTGSYTLQAPLAYNDFEGWNTGINIANLSAASNTVTVTFYDAKGNVFGTPDAVTIPGMGMQFVYIPALGTTPGVFGQAVLSGTAPFTAAVDQVKYSTGEAMSYLATGTTNDRPGGNALGLALFQNGQVTGGILHGDTSGINLQNPGGGTATGTISFYALDGTKLSLASSEEAFSLPAHGGTFVHPPTNLTDLPPNVQVTAVVTATSGQVAAVSNNVNYDVVGDGGAVFTLSSPYGQFRYSCASGTCALQARQP